MCGVGDRNDALFLHVSPESFVPADHPLRPIRNMADKTLASLSGEFEQMYSHTSFQEILLGPNSSPKSNIKMADSPIL